MILTQELRIVSLIASSTEIICALGLLPLLVGRSHECDYPKEVSLLPVCTSPKFETDGTSYQIDQKVKAILQESLSVYHVDADLLNSLRPTHIVTQDQCEVCAVSLKDVEEASCKMISSRPQIVSLKPDRLGDIWADIERVGDALGVADRARSLIEELKNRLSQLPKRANRLSSRPAVAFIEWIEPLMVGGNWMPELIDIAGGTNLFGEIGKHSPPLAWDQLCQADPEIIVIAPCGFDIRRTLGDMRSLAGQPCWKQLRAVSSKRVYVADGNQFFNRPGPRVVESAEILAEMFHPQEFNFNHKGAGWILWADS